MAQANKMNGEPRDAEARVLLFDADGSDRLVPIDALVLSALSPRELAWIDVLMHEPESLAPLLRQLALDLPLQQLLSADTPPLFTRQDWFVARALAPVWQETGSITGESWLLAVGPNALITVHDKPQPFLDELFEHSDPGSHLGVLSADSFAAALLDRMLTVYFAVIDAFEDRVDALEVAMLQPKVRITHLPRLRTLRHEVSMLRRLLTSHRDLFDALPRPDFRPGQDQEVASHFVAVSARYERAVDAVENARDLAIGSFELLATRLSQRTNESMRVLTFATVLLGSLAVIAGVLGMNFDAPLFETGARGFVITIAAMAGIVIAALLFARNRGWLRGNGSSQDRS